MDRQPKNISYTSGPVTWSKALQHSRLTFYFYCPWYPLSFKVIQSPVILLIFGIITPVIQTVCLYYMSVLAFKTFCHPFSKKNRAEFFWLCSIAL
jgi:hypothetical protein